MRNDVQTHGASREEASVHEHGRWITAYVGKPLTFESMDVAERRLDAYLESR